MRTLRLRSWIGTGKPLFSPDHRNRMRDGPTTVSLPVRSISSTFCIRSRTNAITAPRPEVSGRNKTNQHPADGEGRIHNCRVCGAAKSFVDDRVGIVAQDAKILHQFHREVFVKLELHIARIGTRRSSCANSAA